MRDRTILALKGLAIIGVVYHHLSNRRTAPEIVGWEAIITCAFDWCVLAFICISGYLQALSDSKKQRTFPDFSRTRFLRLLVPFFLLLVFYSCIWQALQAAHIPNIAVKIPPDFLGKLKSGLWPNHSQVAEQLYFFPLLFGISIVLVIVQRILRLPGIWAAAVIAGAWGLASFPEDFTGFHKGVFIWGIFFYAAGYLLFHYRDRKTAIRVALLVATAVLIGGSGFDGFIRCIPLWLLAEGATIGIDRVPLLVKLGDASGTIYVYHTPFLVRFLVIATTLLPGDGLQFIAINLDAWVAIGLCYLLFESLKNTRAKVLLM
jgi:hypothetical protein